MGFLKIYTEPSRDLWDGLIKRPYEKRADASSETGSDVASIVAKILQRVKTQGDTALKELSLEIDKVGLSCLQLSDNEIDTAISQVPSELKKAIGEAAANIRKFHEAQLPESVEVETASGVRCIQKAVPLSRVGLYIPGGKAPLFSTVLMLAIPARVAGVREVVLCTPCGAVWSAGCEGAVAPAIVYAAKVCGVSRIFKVGGAQAIAAMAYGTESIPKCDKIFGPGNSFVTKAKQMVALEDVAIDMPAGPSEVMVLADETASRDFAAADLLSQAEHGPDSQVVLVATECSIVDEVEACLEKQLARLGRKEYMLSSLNNGFAVVLSDREAIADFANAYAPEHLIIAMKEPYEIANEIVAAGSVFIGNYSPESAGDYASGTNHTLPTGGWARAFSGVNTESFMRKMTIQELSSAGLKALSDTIITMADAEGLDAHANAVRLRLKLPSVGE